MESRSVSESKITAATSIYKRIKEDLLQGAFPAGLRLNIKEISERYETSVNPVREALSRLAAERILDQREQRGFSVPVLKDSDLEELVKTRCWLEEIAVRESIAHKSEDYEVDLIAAYHRLARTPFLKDDGSPNPEWESRHRTFHMSLLANCQSSWLYSFCDHLMYQATRARYLAVTTRTDAGRLRNDEHEAIMNAAIAGDPDLTVELLKKHYGLTLELVRKADIKS